MAGAEEEQMRVRWQQHPSVPLEQNVSIGQLFVAAHKLRRQPFSEQVGEGRAGGVCRQHGRAGVVVVGVAVQAGPSDSRGRCIGGDVAGRCCVVRLRECRAGFG